MKKTVLLTTIFLTLVFSSNLLAQCMGGRITTTDGATTAYACVNDGEDDFTSFANNSLAMTDYAYVITNDSNVILNITDETFANFGDAGIGNCRVWGLSYEGDLLAEPGDNAATVDLASECFELTENFLTIVRREVPESNLLLLSAGQGGLVTIDNNNNSMVMVANEEGLSDNYIYVLEKTGGKIIDINESGVFDLATLRPSTYLVFGYSFSGNILLSTGNSTTNKDLTDGCFVKSDNQITIQKNSPSSISDCLVDGAMVTNSSGGTISYACVGDGRPDFTGFSNTSIAGARYRYLITDEDNVILSVSEGGFADFEDAGSGNCRVWGVSFEGDLLARPGDIVTEVILGQDCFDLSDNFLTVIRRTTEDTEVSTSEEETSVEITDNAQATFSFINDGENDAEYAYVITRSDDRIIAIVGSDYNFAFEKAGKYFVYGYSYTGEIQFSVGMNASGFISNGCSEKSDNFVYVRKRTDAAPPPPSCTVSAGTMVTEQPVVTLMGGFANVVAIPSGDAIIPDDFDRVYILTSGPNLTVRATSPSSLFPVTELGNYRVHTLIAELNDPSSPDFFDGSGVIPGVTNVADIMADIEAQEVCADVDIMGVEIMVIEDQSCNALSGVLFADASEVPLQPFTFISASLLLEPSVPSDFEVTYFLALGEDKIITQMADAPAFLVDQEGVYNIFMLVAETTDAASPDFFNLSFIVPGITSFDNLALLVEVSSICAALDGLGTNVTVFSANKPERSDDEFEPAVLNTSVQMTAFPNPTIDRLTVRYAQADIQEGVGQYEIIDLHGRLVDNGTLSFQPGYNEWQFQVKGLAPGRYFIKFQQKRLREIVSFV